MEKQKHEEQAAVIKPSDSEFQSKCIDLDEPVADEEEVEVELDDGVEEFRLS